MSKIRVSVFGGYEALRQQCERESSGDKSKLKKLISQQTVEGWETVTAEWEEGTVRGLVENQALSMADFTDGRRRKDSWQGHLGVMLDFDDGQTSPADLLHWAMDTGWKLAVFTSLNHTPGFPKLRCWIPLKESATEQQTLTAINRDLSGRVPGLLDRSFMDKGRFFIHGQGLLHWQDGAFYAPPLPQPVSSGNMGAGRVPSYSMKDTVTLPEGGQAELGTLLAGQRFFCPYCSPEERGNPDTDNAVLLHEAGYPFPILKCSSCEARGRGLRGTGVFLLSKQEVQEKKQEENLTQAEKTLEVYRDRFASYFYLGEKLCKVALGNEAVSVSRAPLTAISGYNEVENLAKRKFLEELGQASKGRIQFDKLADIETVLPWYDWDGDILHAYHPPCQVDVTDHLLVLDWLESLFCEHTDFILDWLAVYACTNHKRLPVLVLMGERGTGKTTFAEWVMSYYPALSAKWHGESRFTAEHQNKLLYIEENTNDSLAMYVMLKKLTGSDLLTIEEKGLPLMQARNNLSFILDTNSSKALHLEFKEMPDDPRNNNFFIYEMPPVAEGRGYDARLKDRLLKVTGAFMQKVLAPRYQELVSSGSLEGNRYQIPCPVTETERQQYALGKSGIDEEAETVWEKIVEERLHNCTARGGVYYLAGSDIQEACRDCRADGIAINSMALLRKRLIALKLIGHEVRRNSQGQRIGYQVLDKRAVTMLRLTEEGKLASLPLAELLEEPVANQNQKGE